MTKQGIINETFAVGDLFLGMVSKDLLEVVDVRNVYVTINMCSDEVHTHDLGPYVFFKLLKSNRPNGRENIGRVFRTNLSNAQRLLLAKVSAVPAVS